MLFFAARKQRKKKDDESKSARLPFMREMNDHVAERSSLDPENSVSIFNTILFPAPLSHYKVIKTNANATRRSAPNAHPPKRRRMTPYAFFFVAYKKEKEKISSNTVQNVFILLGMSRHHPLAFLPPGPVPAAAATNRMATLW